MSLTRARFTFKDSSLASARRFLVLNFVTPAASSMMARRSMGLVERLNPMRLCSLRTQEMASTTLDLPQPLGPTMQVVPEPLKVTTVRSQNDLKPTISTFRSLSKISPFGRQSLRARKQKKARLASCNGQPVPRVGAKAREERRRFVPRGEGLSSNRSIPRTLGSPADTFGRFPVRGPAAWRKDGGTGKNR